jgi:hypothetical protein
MDKIRGSVGRYGVNNDQDVRIVQALLNRHIVPPSRLIKVDGIFGTNTKNAILAFQHRLGITKCDGLITPAGRTFSALNTLPYSVPLSERVLDAFNSFSKMIGKTASYAGLHLKNSFSSIEPSLNAKSSKVPNCLPMLHLPPSPPGAIAWGAKVSPEFKKRVVEICNELSMNPDYLMTCMAFETGESFKASQPNMNGGSAIGLVQFTKTAIDDLNQKYNIQPPLTRERLAAMTDADQLNYVRLYFLHYKGKLSSLEDTYMVILAPVAVGRGPDGTVYKKEDSKHPEYYRANKALDNLPHDGVITLKECSVVLNSRYKKGLSKGYFG